EISRPRPSPAGASPLHCYTVAIPRGPARVPFPRENRNMNLRNPLVALAATACAATLAFAYQQLSLKPDPLNPVAARIQGTWKLDPVVTRRLDPDKAPPGNTITFSYNEGVLPGLQAAASRLSNKQIFSAGVVNIDGGTSGSHTYVLINDNGNMY